MVLRSGLRTLDGLEDLAEVGHWLALEDLPNLAEIRLPALRSAPPSEMDRLVIANIPLITDLDGLFYLEDVRVIEIRDNAGLADCSCGLYPMLDSFPSVSIFYSNNRPGCNSDVEVISGYDFRACNTASEPPQGLLGGLRVEPERAAAWPNPTADRVTVRFARPGEALGAGARVVVLDALGREVAEVLDYETERAGKGVPVEVGHLAPGAYTAALVAGGAVLETTRFSVTR